MVNPANNNSSLNNIISELKNLQQSNNEYHYTLENMILFVNQMNNADESQAAITNFKREAQVLTSSNLNSAINKIIKSIDQIFARSVSLTINEPRSITFEMKDTSRAVPRSTTFEMKGTPRAAPRSTTFEVASDQETNEPIDPPIAKNDIKDTSSKIDTDEEESEVGDFENPMTDKEEVESDTETDSETEMESDTESFRGTASASSTDNDKELNQVDKSTQTDTISATDSITATSTPSTVNPTASIEVSPSVSEPKVSITAKESEKPPTRWEKFKKAAKNILFNYVRPALAYVGPALMVTGCVLAATGFGLPIAGAVLGVGALLVILFLVLHSYHMEELENEEINPKEIHHR